MTRVVLMACVLSMCIVLPAHTTFALERATLAIIGQDCSQWHDAMVEALEQLDGIARAQADVIPNHLLVDHDSLQRTAEELAGFLNRLAVAQGDCRAVVMKSCITAGSSTFSVPSARAAQ